MTPPTKEREVTKMHFFMYELGTIEDENYQRGLVVADDFAEAAEALTGFCTNKFGYLDLDTMRLTAIGDHDNVAMDGIIDAEDVLAAFDD